MITKRSDSEISYLPFHITARTNNKEKFHLDLRKCWSVFSDYLYGINSIFGAKIYAFTLMSNHYHLLAAFPEKTRGETMCWLQTSLAKVLNTKSDRINHLWGGPYHGSLITSPTYFQYALKYIYNNRVSAGICKNPWTYKYSTLRGELGLQKLDSPLSPPKPWLGIGIPKDLNSYLHWIGEKHPEGFDELYLTSWRRKEMKFNTRVARTLNIDGFKL